MFAGRMPWPVLMLMLATAACDKKPVIQAPVEKWVSKKYETWPQIVLTNDAKFKGHTPLVGASSFLIKSSDGRIFAVTAKHLLGENGGVSPQLEVGQFNNALISWKLAPRTVEDLFVEVDKLVAHGDEKEDDWLVFSLKSTSSLASRPLRVRGSPVERDDTVYLLGCPYADARCKQNVYPGHVRGTYGQEISFSLSKMVDLSGFSGAGRDSWPRHRVRRRSTSGWNRPAAGAGASHPISQK